MTAGDQQGLWQRWVHQPQRIWLRRALFQVHLWGGISLGLYILMISVTGSVLVYRNELFDAATAPIFLATGSGPRLTDNQLTESAEHVYPGYHVTKMNRPQNPDQAVDITLERGRETERRLFDAKSGRDLGDSIPLGIRLISKLMALHDDLFAGPMGRKVNGVGAFASLLLVLTGLVIWWPGRQRWRRSLTLHRGVGWKRFAWDVHSMMGFWTFGFVLVIAVSGIYLCIPEEFQNFADRLEPLTPSNAGFRFVDRAIYWLAYMHFGRINGIGIPCSGPGVCDQATKAVWAIFGLAPAVMFVTGALMWWNRVLRPRFRSRRPPL